MLNEKDYCNLTISQALTNIGFTLEMTEHKYERNLLAQRYEDIPKPLLYEAQKYLRDVMDVWVDVMAYNPDLGCVVRGNMLYICRIIFTDNKILHGLWLQDEDERRIVFESHEDALSSGISKAIEIVNTLNER